MRPPATIEPWIIEGDLDRSDVAFLAWRDAAALAIARSLVSEVYQADGKAQVVLAGKPTRRIAFGDLTIEAAGFSMLQQAARWIFVEGPDAELRHTFLVHELARAWEGEEDFGSGLVKRLRQALESASLAYRAHVQDGSRETIKSLADMRKTLAEEITHDFGIRQGVDERFGAFVIAALSFGQMETQWSPASVAHNMQLAGQAAAAAPDTSG